LQARAQRQLYELATQAMLELAPLLLVLVLLLLQVLGVLVYACCAVLHQLLSQCSSAEGCQLLTLLP
jgi:hypothetical protein